MKYTTTHRLDEHCFKLEIASKEGSITIDVDILSHGHVYIEATPKESNNDDVKFFDSITWSDVVDCIVNSDPFIKYDVEKFQRDHLWDIRYNIDTIEVQAFVNKRGDIVWIPVINGHLVNPDASTPAIISKYLDYGKPMCGNDIKFPARLTVAMVYDNLIGLLSATYFSVHGGFADSDDEVEDHDDNLKAYTKTPYTEESMAKVNDMAGHNLDNED